MWGREREGGSIMKIGLIVQRYGEEVIGGAEEHAPVPPGLIEHLRAHHGGYDALIFFSYRYWTTYHGLQVAPAKSILVPTAEDDGAVRLRVFKPFFRQPGAFAFNSAEERELL